MFEGSEEKLLSSDSVDVSHWACQSRFHSSITTRQALVGLQSAVWSLVPYLGRTLDQIFLPPSTAAQVFELELAWRSDTCA